MAGFDAVPDELRGTAGRISDTVAGAANLVWQGPSGDYGHDGVQQAWQHYVDRLKARVDGLRGTAEEFGGQLGTAAGRYAESDDGTRSTLGSFGEAVAGAAGGMTAGGAAGGGVGGAVGGAAAGGISGVLGGAGQER